MPAPAPHFGRSIAAVIGIDGYSNGVASLRNAERDAHAVGSALEFQQFEVFSLLGAEASLARLDHLFREILPSLQPAPERLLIYFAGHGLAHVDENYNVSGFLLPADARRNQEASYWPMARLLEVLQPALCKHLLVILDCCFAGTFPHPTVWDLRGEDTFVPLEMERFRHYTAHRSFQLLLSTAQDEFAPDRLLSRARGEVASAAQHSPFACALLEALDPSKAAADFNGDGLFTATELYVYVRDRLVSLLAGTGARQTPAIRHMKWHDRGEFLFALNGERKPKRPE